MFDYKEAKLKILFLGCLFNQEEESILLEKSRVGLAGAGNTYQWNLIKGIEIVLGKPIDIINVLPVGTFPRQHSDFYLKSRKWSHSPGADDHEIGSINIPIIKQITRTMSCKSQIKKWIGKSDANRHIILYSTYLPFLFATKAFPKNLNTTLIVTDLPEYYELHSQKGFCRKLVRLIYNRMIYRTLNYVESYVILTEQMKESLGIGHKPYIVIEGIVDKRVINHDEIEGDCQKKIILYSGTLTYRFGIMNLLDAFRAIDDEMCELWICGKGEAEEEILKRCRSDNRIKYFGYVTKEHIWELMPRATLLINPRKNSAAFTKYSFPSKTMEYMLSGRPVLMYKLDGIPAEYDDYLYYVTGDSIDNLKEAIETIISKPEDELRNFGNKAKSFVTDRKNNVIQASRLIDMMKKSSGLAGDITLHDDSN